MEGFYFSKVAQTRRVPQTKFAMCHIKKTFTRKRWSSVFRRTLFERSKKSMVIKPNSLQKTVADYIAALESGDSKRIAATGKRLNQVGFSPISRRVEIERQAKGNAKLEAAIEMVKQQVKDNLAAKQRYLSNRKWSLNTQLSDIALAQRKRWQHFGE